MTTLAAPARANAEAQTRMQVAACTLLLVREKLMSYSGHVSARLLGRDAFLIQPREVPRSGLRPDDLLVVDFDGAVVEGSKDNRPPSEVAIHAEILRARPDVNAVAHFHHDMTNSFTLVEDMPLRVLKNHAVRWKDGIPVHPDPAHVHGAELGRALVKTLGSRHALQIRAHGQVITAESVEAALIDSIHFVENAMAMYHAAALGRLAPLSDADIASFEREFKRDAHIKKLWRYYTETAQAEGVIPADWDL